MANFFQTTGIVWALIPTEKQFISQALSGILLTIVFVFIVLLIATQNLI